MAAAGDERYLLCAAVAAGVFWNLWLQIALEWLHECCMGFVLGRKPGAGNLAFFRVKWLQPAMKGASCVRRLRLRSFGSSSVFCNKWLLLCA